MNNIIKEKHLKEVLYGLDFIGNKNKNNDGILELGVNNCKLLLDYITNLQEENKRLKEYQEGYRKEIDYWRIQFSNNKDRIDKAIEYIEEHNIPYTSYLGKEERLVNKLEIKDKDFDDLLDILRGEDNDN